MARPAGICLRTSCRTQWEAPARLPHHWGLSLRPHVVAFCFAMPSQSKMAAAGTGATKKGALPKNIFKKVAAQTCAGCGQTTHDMEMDCILGKGTWLKWTKTKFDSKGNVVANGSECYFCFDTRRTRFEKIDFQELLALRRDDKDLDTKFLGSRREKVQGIDKGKVKDKIDAKKFVTEKKRQSYRNRFREFTFTELWAFARLGHP